MGTSTNSTNWGAIGTVSASGGLGLNASGTIYLFRNHDNGDKFLFLLADLGLGGSLGITTKKIKTLVKTILNSHALYDVRSYSDIPANRPFSADDLNLARGAEATASAAVVAGYSATVISGFPFFTGAPDGEANHDYFTGANVSGYQIGVGVGAAYRFYGMWFKLWSFQ
jgi:hypothetical protein